MSLEARMIARLRSPEWKAAETERLRAELRALRGPEKPATAPGPPQRSASERRVAPEASQGPVDGEFLPGWSVRPGGGRRL